MVKASAAALLCLLLLAGQGAQGADEARFYVQPSALAPQPIAALGGFAGRILSENAATGRLAAELQLPARFRDRLPRRFAAHSQELVVLDGTVSLGKEKLAARDFAYIPAGRDRDRLASAQGSRVLLFLDPAPPDAAVRERLRSIGPYVTRYREDRWNPGSLSQLAGFDLRLEIQHLKKDPLSGARTWLVRLEPPVTMPFEVHSVAEEAYLLEGRFSQPECMPDGLRTGVYEANSYFFRPPGIPHSGPGAGPLERSTFLMRTPGNLDVVFYAQCQNAKPSQRITTAGTTQREVGELLARWAEAANKGQLDGIASLMADDPRYIWIENGRVAFADRAAMLAGLETARRSGSSVTLELSDIRVEPLTSELAAARAAYRMRYVPAPGAQAMELRGIFTATALFSEGRWQFLQGHLSQRR